MWEIPEEYLSLSDYELILLEWKNLDSPSQKNSQVAMIRWNIRNLVKMISYLKLLKVTRKNLVTIIHVWNCFI